VLQMHFQTDMIFGRCAGGVVATFFGEAVRVFQGFLIGKVTQKKGRFGSAVGMPRSPLETQLYQQDGKVALEI
jgi:hypothetical protein